MNRPASLVHQSGTRLEAAAEAARTRWEGAAWSDVRPWEQLDESQRREWRALASAVVAAYEDGDA